MTKKSNRIKMYGRLALPVAAVALMFTSCEKDYMYVAKPVVITKTLSYSGDIQPIFNASCSVSGCHDGSNYDPDLTPANSWQALQDMGDIDTTTPANSILYVRITLPTSDKHFMPKGGSPLSATETANILTWIEQGAKNN